MNKDYKKQESTEAYTEIIIRNDDYLKRCLDEDGIDINSLINYKSNTIVDNDRPKLCADRLDGVITTDIGWTQVLSKEDIKNIIENRCIYTNEYGEDENDKLYDQIVKIDKYSLCFININLSVFFDFLILRKELRKWAVQGLNLRPPPCKGDALPS